ncbi:hypothetical protein V5799_025678 [Amblyomma americanum]|uniref:MAM domain-containing protein n=1 Tax=Amblyomma americanum TaxID=6943 RepID=A0AAQ4E8U7_AMBAM
MKTWSLARAEIPVQSEDFTVVIEGTVWPRPGTNALVAVDNVILGLTPPVHVANCDFQLDLCGYIGSFDSDFRWLVGSGRVFRSQPGAPTYEAISSGAGHAGSFAYVDPTVPMTPSSKLTATIRSAFFNSSGNENMTVHYFRNGTGHYLRFSAEVPGKLAALTAGGASGDGPRCATFWYLLSDELQGLTLLAGPAYFNESTHSQWQLAQFSLTRYHVRLVVVRTLIQSKAVYYVLPGGALSTGPHRRPPLPPHTGLSLPRGGGVDQSLLPGDFGQVRDGLDVRTGVALIYLESRSIIAVSGTNPKAFALIDDLLVYDDDCAWQGDYSTAATAGTEVTTLKVTTDSGTTTTPSTSRATAAPGIESTTVVLTSPVTSTAEHEATTTEAVITDSVATTVPSTLSGTGTTQSETTAAVSKPSVTDTASEATAVASMTAVTVTTAIASVTDEKASPTEPATSSATPETSASSTTASSSRGCGIGMFSCRDGVHCVPALLLCDGVRDCPNGADEICGKGS